LFSDNPNRSFYEATSLLADSSQGVCEMSRDLLLHFAVPAFAHSWCDLLALFIRQSVKLTWLAVSYFYERFKQSLYVLYEICYQ